MGPVDKRKNNGFLYGIIIISVTGGHFYERKQNSQIQIMILDIDSMVPQDHLLRRIKNCVKLALCFFSPAFPAAAQAVYIVPSSKETVVLANGDYLETVIMDVPTISSGISIFSTTKMVTKTKTTSYKNANGITLWSLSIRVSFTYNGSTSRSNTGKVYGSVDFAQQVVVWGNPFQTHYFKSSSF